MRAAYGKGYCDALTEDIRASLCDEHGYRIPGAGARPSPPASASSSRLRRYHGVARSARVPVRLVLALSVAAVLAVFLLYVSVAGGATPS